MENHNAREMEFKALKDFTRLKNHFMNYNGIALEEVDLDHAVTTCVLCKDGQNPLGYAHGGLMFTMADCACGALARAGGAWYVTQNSDFHYISNITEGTLVARATVLHRGRQTCVLRCRITCGETDALLVESTFTFFRVNGGPTF